MILNKDQVSKLAGPGDNRLAHELEDWLIIRMFLNGINLKELLSITTDAITMVTVPGLGAEGKIHLSPDRVVTIDHVTAQLIPLYTQTYQIPPGEILFDLSERSIRAMIERYGDIMGLPETLTVTVLRKTALYKFVTEDDPVGKRKRTLMEIQNRMGYSRLDYTVGRIKALAIEAPEVLKHPEMVPLPGPPIEDHQ